MNIIEELFYGNLNFSGQSGTGTCGYQKAMDTISENEDQLINTLDKDEKQKVMDISNAYGIVLGEITVEEFVRGFRIGARFALDTFGPEAKELLENMI